ncbi:Transcriptional regulatory protein SrrA [Paenibacillus plantiphilus]|uniref:Transcriptional regulatory protein SrrA n=1 Tax=Paenibacillus plantiphilus TaxID=2905650 RepID=A0ABN8GQJ6_9BACL|nr:response regulator transcription factor [Paenibacillus plantiphilus]CAH1212470.1 Transcriptional regulatory protein SrrA [Paenibacillus plantiphilus]
MRDKIIIVDDDDDHCKLLVQYLSKHGFEVIGCSYSGQDTIGLFHSHVPDLIILDLLTPRLEGLELCTEIRKVSDIPILFVSTYADDYVKISAFNLGGDDYISKPLNLDVLLARIKAQIRRNKRAFPVNQRHLLQYPGLEVDLSTHTVLSYGKEAILSTKEFQLLVLLAKNPNRVFHTETLYDLIWRDSKLGDVRTVMVHIYNLRQKIEEQPHNPRYIHTVRGAGYKFNGAVSLTAIESHS